MDIEEEDAPALVDANEVKEISRQHGATSATSQLRNLSLVKVPLTIVTGEWKEPSNPVDVSLISNIQVTLVQGRLRWSTTSLKSSMARKLRSS